MGLSWKPRVDSGDIHSLETENYLLTIVGVIYSFIFHHLLLAKIILWRCDSLHLCAFQELVLPPSAETGPLHMSRNVAKTENVVKTKTVVACHILGFHLLKKHMGS